MLLQMRPVQMARMTGKVGVVLRSSVEQAIPRVRPVVALGFEYSTGCRGGGGRFSMGGVLWVGEVAIPKVRYPRLVWGSRGAVAV